MGELVVRSNVVRQLRGASRNAVAWGVAWFIAACAIITLLRLVGVAAERFTWLGALGLAIKFGIIGGISGAAFSGLVAFLYRGRRLRDISWVRFGLIGGVATGVFVPLFLQAMNLISGGGLVPWSLVMDDAITTAVLGGAAAAGLVKLAQHADKKALPGAGQENLPSASEWDT